MSGSQKGVRGGTITSFDEPLCRTCRNAQYIRGQSESQRLLICDELTYVKPLTPMPWEVYECSKYDDKRRATKQEMEQTAWILRTDPKSKGSWGFVSPAQRKAERRDSGTPWPGDDE